jgi:hypothetical protein
MSFSAMGCLQSTRALVVDTGIARRLLGLIRQRGNLDGALEVSSVKSEICRDLPDTLCFRLAASGRWLNLTHLCRRQSA